MKVRWTGRRYRDGNMHPDSSYSDFLAGVEATRREYPNLRYFAVTGWDERGRECIVGWLLPAAAHDTGELHR